MNARAYGAGRLNEICEIVQTGHSGYLRKELGTSAYEKVAVKTRTRTKTDAQHVVIVIGKTYGDAAPRDELFLDPSDILEPFPVQPKPSLTYGHEVMLLTCAATMRASERMLLHNARWNKSSAEERLFLLGNQSGNSVVRV